MSRICEEMVQGMWQYRTQFGTEGCSYVKSPRLFLAYWQDRQDIEVRSCILESWNQNGKETACMLDVTAMAAMPTFFVNRLPFPRVWLQ